MIMLARALYAFALFPALTNAASVEEYLPKSGTIHATFYARQFAPGTEELAARLHESVSKHPEWFAEYVKSHEGELPYHPRFGISRAEYQKYLTLTRESRLRPSMSQDFKVQREGSGISFKTQGHESVLDELTFFSGDHYVLTPYGKLTNESDFDNPNSELGRTTGLKWNKEQLFDEGGGMAVTVYIGRRTGTNVGSLYYRVNIVKPDGKREKFDIIIDYPLDH